MPTRKPVLQAMVIADHVYKDTRTGKHVIAGTFTMMLPSSGESTPTNEQSGTPFLYLALVEVFDKTLIELRFVNLAEGDVLWQQHTRLNHQDPLGVAEFIYALPKLPVGGPGHYSLDVLHDGEILGSWRVRVLEQESDRAKTTSE